MPQILGNVISEHPGSKFKQNGLRHTHCLVSCLTKVMAILVQYLRNKPMVTQLAGKRGSLLSLREIVLTITLGERKTIFFYYSAKR